MFGVEEGRCQVLWRLFAGEYRISKVEDGSGRVMLTKVVKRWLEVRTDEELTAFAFAGLLDRQTFGKETDKRRLKPLAMGPAFNSKYDRRIEYRK